MVYKMLILMKITRIDKKYFVLHEPEPEKRIQNGSGSKSKGPKKPGSGSTTLAKWNTFIISIKKLPEKFDSSTSRVLS